MSDDRRAGRGDREEEAKQGLRKIDRGLRWIALILVLLAALSLLFSESAAGKLFLVLTSAAAAFLLFLRFFGLAVRTAQGDVHFRKRKTPQDDSENTDPTEAPEGPDDRGHSP